MNYISVSLFTFLDYSKQEGNKFYIYWIVNKNSWEVLDQMGGKQILHLLDSKQKLLGSSGPDERETNFTFIG